MLLAIDTCGFVGGVALGDGAAAGAIELDASSSIFFRELVGKTFSERLLSTISELLAEASVSLEQLTGVVVVYGPGSFTGIRIGVSAAKGLVEALAIPLIAVSRLTLLARKSADGRAVAVLDAGRGEFYVGVCGSEDSGNREMLLTRDPLMALIAESGLTVIACEERVVEALADAGVERFAAPTAVDALHLGWERIRAGSFDDVATLEANYIRRTDSEMLARIAEHAAIRAEAAASR